MAGADWYSDDRYYHADGRREVRVFISVCLSVFPHISQKLCIQGGPKKWYLSYNV